MAAGRPIGTVFVELDLDPSRYTKGQQQLLRDAKQTSFYIEDNFKALGIKSAATFDLMREKINNNFKAIANNAKATANDIVRAEEAKHRQLTALNEQQFGKQTSMLGSLKEQWASLAGPALLALGSIGGAVAAMGYAAKSSIDSFQKLAFQTRDLAFLSGGTAQEVSGLIDVLDDYGVEASTVERAMVFLSKAVQDGSPALDRLGISIRNSSGHLKTAHDLFYETIDALKNTRSETERNALAQELFSRGWIEMVPIIEKGSDALRRAAEASGLMMSRDDIARADEYRKSMADLGDALEKLKITIGRGIIVPITTVIRRYTEGPQAGDQYLDEFGLLNTRQAPVAPDLSGTVRPGSGHTARTTGPVEGETPGEKKVREEREKARAKELEELKKFNAEMQRFVADSAKAELDSLNMLAKARETMAEKAIEGYVAEAEEQIALDWKVATEEVKRFEETYATKDALREQELKNELWSLNVEKEALAAFDKYELDRAEKMVKVQEEAAAKSAQAWKESLSNIRGIAEDAFAGMRGAISTSIRGIIQGTQTMQDAFKRMGESIALGLVDSIINRGLKSVENALLDFAFGGSGGGGGGGGGMFSGLGSTLLGWGQSALTWLGWLDSGMWNVPRTTQPAYAGLHPGEMVVPADAAEMLRRLFALLSGSTTGAPEPGGAGMGFGTRGPQSTAERVSEALAANMTPGWATVIGLAQAVNALGWAAGIAQNPISGLTLGSIRAANAVRSLDAIGLAQSLGIANDVAQQVAESFRSLGWEGIAAIDAVFGLENAISQTIGQLNDAAGATNPNSSVGNFAGYGRGDPGYGESPGMGGPSTGGEPGGSVGGPGGNQGQGTNTGGALNAAGALFTTRGRTRMVVGEAGAETVAVLRNPRSVDVNGRPIEMHLHIHNAGVMGEHLPDNLMRKVRTELARLDGLTRAVR